MAKVQGVLFKVYEKAWQGKTLRSFKLDGNPLYYRWGERPVPAGVVAGATLTFEAEAKDDKSAIIKGDVTVSAAQAAAPQASDKSTSAPVDWAAKDAAIQYQSSRKDALAFLALPGVLEGILGKAKPADKLGIVEATLDKYTAGFFADIANFGAVTRSSGAAEAAEPTPGADEDEE